MRKTNRQYLLDYDRARCDMERFEMCIAILEQSSDTPFWLIKRLKSMQQKCLTKMDRAAEKLGAPYA